MASELDDVVYNDDILCSECHKFGAWVELAGIFCANCGADLTPPEPPLSYFAAMIQGALVYQGKGERT